MTGNQQQGSITMTPQQIAALTAAEMEHSGYTLTPAGQREIKRNIADNMARRKRFGEMMRGPAYQWKKPPARRSSEMVRFISYHWDAPDSILQRAIASVICDY
jgi:hypothetical protein